jgi:hypothetical protein
MEPPSSETVPESNVLVAGEPPLVALPAPVAVPASDLAGPAPPEPAIAFPLSATLPPVPALARRPSALGPFVLVSAHAAHSSAAINPSNAMIRARAALHAAAGISE